MGQLGDVAAQLRREVPRQFLARLRGHERHLQAHGVGPRRAVVVRLAQRREDRRLVDAQRDVGRDGVAEAERTRVVAFQEP